jgi:hypothetical protein
MHMKHFGDSYDIVKQSLIRWLGEFGSWSVHPMLTESASAPQLAAFERFLGARVICAEVLTTATDRGSYLSCPSNCGNLFLDPDTGISLRESRLRKPKTEYLFASELRRVIEERPEDLTLVFDQSLARGSERRDMKPKLDALQEHGISCFAYISQASFVLCSGNEALIRRAIKHVSTESRLPASCFFSGGASYL